MAARICSLLRLVAVAIAAPTASAGVADAADAADECSMLQRAPLSAKAVAGRRVDNLTIVSLRRESVPIYRKGKVASYKTSYSGLLTLGTPAQEFRVVFDTGSGHLVVPAAECMSEACLVSSRRKFNMSNSETSIAVNSDGSVVPPGEHCDQVTIGFGTGEITGEFTRDIVCFDVTPTVATVDAPVAESSPNDGQADKGAEGKVCVEMSVILAVEMSTQPFKTFRFDGILGLGLGGLALDREFSFFDMLLGKGLPEPRFGIFLTEGEDGEESEVAFGGIDRRRYLEEISWVPVVSPEHGHWQVAIKAVRVNGHEIDLCKDGTCKGVVDTGTSHLGVPAPADQEVGELLTTEAGDLLDCRIVDAPSLEIELATGATLVLHPWNYMRRLPLREGISVSSTSGVTVSANKTQQEATTAPNVEPKAGADADSEAESVKRFCRPRLMPVRLPPPIGPKLFILGEPVLHRFYTVYDWEAQRVGFSLANNRRNTMDPETFRNGRGTLPAEVEMLLYQKSVSLTERDPVPLPVS